MSRRRPLPPKCKPKHLFNGLGQCQRCGIWKMGTPERYIADFWRGVQKTETCWIWVGQIDAYGYGAYSYQATQRKAHRFMWMLMHGEIDPHLDLDHLCKNTRCVNPLHLEPVTRAENHRRCRADFCGKGHAMMGDNVYLYKGGKKRRCRACMSKATL